MMLSSQAVRGLPRLFSPISSFDKVKKTVTSVESTHLAAAVPQ